MGLRGSPGRDLLWRHRRPWSGGEVLLQARRRPGRRNCLRSRCDRPDLHPVKDGPGRDGQQAAAGQGSAQHDKDYHGPGIRKGGKFTLHGSIPGRMWTKMNGSVCVRPSCCCIPLLEIPAMYGLIIPTLQNACGPDGQGPGRRRNKGVWGWDLGLQVLQLPGAGHSRAPVPLPG